MVVKDPRAIAIEEQRALEQAAYVKRLLDRPWDDTSLELVYYPLLSYQESRGLYHGLGEARQGGLLHDTFIYARRKMGYALTAADNPKGRDIASRAENAGVTIIGYYTGQKNCNFYPRDSHVFHYVSRGRHDDTGTALQAFWGIVLRTLVHLGIAREDLNLLGNNLTIRGKRAGLLAGPRVKGKIHLEPPLVTDDTIAVSVTLNQEFPVELGREIFAGDRMEITCLRDEVGTISSVRMLTALDDANPEVFHEPVRV